MAPCSGPFLVALLGISVGLADSGARIASFVVLRVGFCMPPILIVAAFAGPIRVAFVAAPGA